MPEFFWILGGAGQTTERLNVHHLQNSLTLAMINPKSIFAFTEHDGKVTWQVPENLPYFEGHFPGNPILPGVAVLDLIQELLGSTFKTIKSTKFTEMIRPLDTLTIEKKLDPVSNSWSIQVFNQHGVSVCKAVVELI